MKYRKKPVVVEAIQYTGKNKEECEKFAGKSLIFDIIYLLDHITMPEVKIKTLEGDMRVHEGDYIIRGIEGEFYSCRPDIFEKSYELVGDNDESKI